MRCIKALGGDTGLWILQSEESFDRSDDNVSVL